MVSPTNHKMTHPYSKILDLDAYARRRPTRLEVIEVDKVVKCSY